MALQNNDIIQTTWVGSCFGQLIEMVRNYVVLGPFPVTQSITEDLQSINQAIINGGANDIQTPYLALLPASYTLQLVKSQRIGPVRSVYIPLVFAGGRPGTNAGAASSANHSAGITLRTALAGRKQRGTVKIGPTPDAAAANGLIVPAYSALLSTLGDRLLTSFVPLLSGSILAPIVYHADHTFDLFNTVLIQPTSRVKARRTVGVGA